MDSSKIEFHVFHRKDPKSSAELLEVASIAENFRTLLDSPLIAEAIAEVHRFGSSSQKVQAAIAPLANSLGFLSEKKGLFSNVSVPGLRPDFFLKTASGGGILMEVERGKTIANNMDLLDVWKTHLCAEANHLFLLVPQIRETERGAKQKIYQTVLNRVGTFFESGVEAIDVDSISIFGY